MEGQYKKTKKFILIYILYIHKILGLVQSSIFELPAQLSDL